MRPIGMGRMGEPDEIAKAALFLRSEEHTSELQSHLNFECRLLLEKQKFPLSTHRNAQKPLLRSAAPPDPTIAITSALPTPPPPAPAALNRNCGSTSPPPPLRSHAA